MITDHLRHPSARPTLLVDRHGRAVGEAGAVSRVGRDGPFGRNRVVFTLPMDPVELVRPRPVKDRHGILLADPDGVVVGFERIIVHRMLWAGKIEDTRRL